MTEMDEIKKEIILKTILETGLLDSQNSGNNLLNNAINKSRKKIRLQRTILSIFNKKTDLKLKAVKRKNKFLSKIEQYSNDEFERNFMMKRTTFIDIAKCLERNWKAKTGRPSISIDIALYITIWKLTKNSTYRELSDLFNIAQGSCFTNFIKVVNLLYTNRNKFIKWPNDNESKMQIVEKFRNIKDSIPNTIGCVDAINIRINGPRKDKYIDKNGGYSIILQGICDSEKRFLDVFFGQPGSYSKSNVWENSPINDTFKKKFKAEQDEYILGDSEYPLKPYLIVPYCCDNDNLSTKQKIFNNQHKFTWSCIDESFKILKRKFLILESIDVKDLNNIKYIVIACVVLHNIIIEKEEIDNWNSKIDEENVTSDSDLDLNENSELNKAKNIRDTLAMRCVS